MFDIAELDSVDDVLHPLALETELLIVVDEFTLVGHQVCIVVAQRSKWWLLVSLV